MSDEQTIYISPDDDLTTVRGRLEQIPARKITLVIPNQTQLRSHVAWKLLYARTRELNKEVLIVSSDPQVRSVAHAVKFKVAHSLESTSNPGRSKSGSRSGPGRSNAGALGAAGRSRPSAPSRTTTRATTAKEPSIGRGESRSSRPIGEPIAGQISTWSEPGSFAHPEPDNLQQSQSRFNPRAEQTDVIRPPLFNLPERPQREERGSRFNQPYEFRIENPSAIHPLFDDQVEEEPDLLIEDYEQAQDIRQAASGALPAIKKQIDSEPGNTSPDASNAPVSHVPTDQSRHSNAQIYGEDDPFIYMQDDSQPPSQAEQKGEATVEDEENSQEYPSLQKSAISAIPTSVMENKIEYRGDDDEDDIIPPLNAAPASTPAPMTPSRPRPEQRPILRPEPEPIPLPMPRAQSRPLSRAQSKPLSPTSRPLSGRTTGKMPDKPTTAPITRGGSRAPQSVASRPASQPGKQRGGSTRPNSATGLTPLRPVTTNRTRKPRNSRLPLILIPIALILIVLFCIVYLNIASTVKLMVTTQDYTHPVTLVLSNKNLPNTVPATPVTRTFTKTGSEPATGTKMQATNYATGVVNFTNAGTTSVQIPSQTVIATANNINFVTTANALIPPQSAGADPIPVPIQASNSGVSGNVPAGSITAIPQSSLVTIAQAQVKPVTADSLKTILTVANPDATTGGEAKAVAAITQQDLANATKDLHQQVLSDINTWIQQNAKNNLVGQAVTTDTLINPPSVDQAEPDKTFSANIKVVATILVARLDAAQKNAASLLTSAVHADKQFGPAFAIIGDPQTIKITQVQSGTTSDNAVTVNATGQVGPSLNVKEIQNSITGKSFAEAQAIVRRQNQRIQIVNIQTQPSIFNWVSPWADHITVTVLSSPPPAPKK